MTTTLFIFKKNFIKNHLSCTYSYIVLFVEWVVRKPTDTFAGLRLTHTYFLFLSLIFIGSCVIHCQIPFFLTLNCLPKTFFGDVLCFILL